MSLEVIAIGSDNLVRLDALTNASTGAFVNNATVTFVVTDANGNIVLNTTTMTFVSNGRYEGTIPASITNAMAQNALYTIAITAIASGITLFRRLSAIAKYRSSS